MRKKFLSTPLGEMTAISLNGKIRMLEFSDRRELEGEIEGLSSHYHTLVTVESDKVLEDLSVALDLYFSGQERKFNLPLDPGGTQFQQEVWNGLCSITYGETCTYQQQAGKLGSPSAARAVAGAIAQNPILLLVPCHRVIGSDGALRGYKAGLWRKEKLIELETKFKLSKKKSAASRTH